jgi:predicted enzyme related to lactoylglutathione lyase
MLRGLATISFYANDLEAAKAWYAKLLGVDPYFERHFEDPQSGEERLGDIEFRLGDYQHELGIIDRSFAPYEPADGPSGAVVFWHVDDVDAALARLKAMDAKELEPRIDREAGFVTASVVDPFGNILGVMYNPHYLDVLGSLEKS